MGLSIAVCVRVGTALGAADTVQAKRSAVSGMLCTGEWGQGLGQRGACEPRVGPPNLSPCHRPAVPSPPSPAADSSCSPEGPGTCPSQLWGGTHLGPPRLCFLWLAPPGECCFSGFSPGEGALCQNTDPTRGVSGLGGGRLCVPHQPPGEAGLGTPP